MTQNSNNAANNRTALNLQRTRHLLKEPELAEKG
jgi:hypothetical protein